MKIKSILSYCVLAAAFLCAGAANAMVYQFTLTGHDSAQWQIDSERVPDYTWPNSITKFLLEPVGEEYAEVTFFSGTNGGGFDLLGLVEVTTTGEQLYTGSESAPVFRIGVFVLDSPAADRSHTLTISVAPVPEPETYAMLIAGLGLMGLMAHRRRKRAKVSAL